ncbi:MAG: acetyl-CoA carboxylase biotin carboxyl carrier protein [Anaeroplasmataceae bacterium]
MTEDIEKIIKIFEKANISKLELEVNDIKLKLEKDGIAVNNLQHTPNPQQQCEAVDSNIYITAPLVGTYYAQRSEKAKPFIEIGKKVSKGDVLCIIEAMKVMNEVVAPKDCIIKDILIENEQLVEFGQNIIVLGDE